MLQIDFLHASYRRGSLAELLMINPGLIVRESGQTELYVIDPESKVMRKS